MRSYCSRRILLLCFLIAALSACGGGGSGGSDKQKEYVGGSGLAVSTKEASLVLDKDGPNISTSIKVSWSNSFSVTRVITSVPPGMETPSWLSATLIGSSSPQTLSISLTSTSIAIGDYQTTVRVISYHENQKMDYIDIPVKVQVLQRPTVDTKELSFSMVEGALPTPQTITFSRPGEELTIDESSSILYGNPVWASRTINTTDHTIEVSITDGVNSLAPGEYSTSLEVNYNGGHWSIPVKLTLEGAMKVDPVSVAFDITLASTAADKTQTITVSSNSGNVINWEASSDLSWLSVTPSGDTQSANTLTVTLQQSELDTMRNGNYSGEIVVSSSVSDDGVSPVTIPVTLSLHTPEVSYVAPYQTAGAAGEEVIIRGFGFDQISNPVVSIGSNTIASSDLSFSGDGTQIRATHPAALTAGDYAITVVGTDYSAKTFATLKVSSQSYTSKWYTADTALGIVDNLWFDSVNEAVFFRSASNFTGSIVRYQYNSTSTDWDLTATADRTFKYGGVALMPDGSAFFAHSITDAVKVNTGDLTVEPLLSNTTGTNGNFKSAAFVNNGMLCLTETSTTGSKIYTYDTASNDPATLALLPFPNAISDSDDRIAKASLDGSLVYFVDQSNATEVLYYDSSTGELLSSGQTVQGASLSVDKTGDHLIIGTDVYVFDGTLKLLDSLPSTIQASVITPDGNTAYTFESDDMNGATFREFDLTSSVGNGFTEVSNVTVTPDPAVADPHVVVNPHMAISPDAATLFVVGETDFIVQPAPAP